MTKKEKLIEPWKIFASTWRKITSPGRPTKGEIEIYRKFLQPVLKRKSAQILILGATPELRDLLAPYKNIQVVLVDINLEMILAMIKFMKNKNPNEIWIKADWIKAPLQENYFDAVLGDFVLQNLPANLQSQLLFKIKKILKPHGFFITRHHCYYQGYRQSINLEELFKIFSGWPANLKTANAFWEIGVFCMSRTRSGEHRVIDFWNKIKKYYRGNERYYHPNSHIKKILEVGHQLLPLDKKWFNLTEKDFEKFLGKYFKTIDCECDFNINLPPEYKDWAPIYQLRPKK